MKQTQKNRFSRYRELFRKRKNINKLACSSLFIFSMGMYAQTPAQRSVITQKSNMSVLHQLQTGLDQQESTEKKEALRLARKNHWEVEMYLEDGSYAELQKIGKNGTPLYYTTYNTDAAKSTRTDHLNTGGTLGLQLDGQGMTAYVWDGGHARITHQEYDGAGGNDRVSIEDAASEGGVKLDYHAAHVTGTIIASGVVAKAKGMAPMAKVKGYKWNKDKSEATAAAANGMLVSNHSYGWKVRDRDGTPLLPDFYFGAYVDESRAWDEIMYNAPYYLMVSAAGNSGRDNTVNSKPLGNNTFYDKLHGHGTSKNNLVVANAQDAAITPDGTLTNVVINEGSSEGPTDDLRIKPDIAGNGTGVYSTFENSDTAYRSIGGTSMASPNVAGTLLLLQQHHNNVYGSFMKAATLKGLALHTASDAGDKGPDAIFGWGLLNAKRAATVVSEKGKTTKIEEHTLTNNQTYTITVESDGVSPLMASISWTDRPGTPTTELNSPTAKLVQDLDIRITQGTTTYNPYKLISITANGTGDNTVDPYERIDVANASGVYTITVTHKGTLVGGSQDYSLIISGIKGTAATCTAGTPENINFTDVTETSAVVSWNEVPNTTYELQYRKKGASQWTEVTSAKTTYSLQNLASSSVYELRLRSLCTDGSMSSYSEMRTFTTNGGQVVYCATQGNDASYEYIGNVIIGKIDNTSQGKGYSDFTSISTAVTRGSTQEVQLTPVWTSGRYNEAYSIWIDYNHDGDFEDPGEQVWTQAATKVTPVKGSFTIPESARLGATRMRVAMAFRTVSSPCGVFDFGEVEDYTVTIEAPATTDEDEEDNEEEAFTIFPNPVINNKLHVQQYEKKHDTFAIYNSHGYKVIWGKFIDAIDVSKLDPGMYLINIDGHLKRFIKQ